MRRPAILCIPGLAALLALAAPVFAQDAALAPLAAADVPALLQAPAHGRRIIALWALDCAYCEAHLQALLQHQRAHPRDIELVLVATDNIALGADIEARLHAIGADGVTARAYADATPERINYLLDPGWGGETPRTLVIRADGSRSALSGTLTAAQRDAL